jgi:uncharacterized protein (DUF1499 family)
MQHQEVFCSMIMRIVWLALAVALIYAGLRLAVNQLSKTSVAQGPVERDGKLQLADCPDTPNCQGSQSTRGNQQLPALAFSAAADEVMGKLASAIGTREGATIITQNDAYLHATFQTQAMGYIDDLEFLLDEAAGVVQVRSASRLGRKDFGANQKRIEALRAQLAATL